MCLPPVRLAGTEARPYYITVAAGVPAGHCQCHFFKRALVSHTDSLSTEYLRKKKPDRAMSWEGDGQRSVGLFNRTGRLEKSG